MPDITVSLESKANLAGFQQTTNASRSLAEAINQMDVRLRVADRKVQESVGNWERRIDGAMKGLTRAFQPEKIVGSFLGGFGIGSAFAIIDKAIAKATEGARKLDESIAAVRKAEAELAATREKIDRGNRSPRMNLIYDQEELTQVEARIDELKAIERTVTYRRPLLRRGPGGDMVESGQFVEEQRQVSRTVAENNELEQKTKRRGELLTQIAELEKQVGQEISESNAKVIEFNRQRDEEKKRTEARRREQVEERLERIGQQQADAETAKLPVQEQITRLLAEDAQLKAEASALDVNNTAQLERGADIETRRLEIARLLEGAYRNQANEVDRMHSKALSELGREKVLISANPLTTDAEKRKKLIPILEQEKALIGDRIKSLETELSLTKDPAIQKLLEDRLERLRGEQNANAAALLGARPATKIQESRKAREDLTDPTKHFQSAGEGVEGGLLGALVKFGTIADQIAVGIENTIGAAVESVSSGIMGWINGTMTFGQALRNIGSSILQSMLQTLIQMGVQWVINGVLAKGVLLGIEATGDTMRAARVAKENAAEAATLPAKTAGAAASGISSFGAALAFGLIAVALIASLAGGFAEGGYTGGTERTKPAGVVHEGEWVAPQWLVGHPVAGPLIQSLEAMRTGAAGYSLGGFFKENLFYGLPKAFMPKIAKDYNPFEGRKFYGEASSQTYSFDAAAQSWVESMASGGMQSLTRPYQAPPAQGSGAGGDGAASLSQREISVNFVDSRDHDALERIERDPRFDAVFVRMLRKHRGRIGVSL